MIMVIFIVVTMQMNTKSHKLCDVVMNQVNLQG